MFNSIQSCHFELGSDCHFCQQFKAIPRCHDALKHITEDYQKQLHLIINYHYLLIIDYRLLIIKLLC